MGFLMAMRPQTQLIEIRLLNQQNHAILTLGDWSTREDNINAQQGLNYVQQGFRLFLRFSPKWLC